MINNIPGKPIFNGGFIDLTEDEDFLPSSPRLEKTESAVSVALTELNAKKLGSNQRVEQLEDKKNYLSKLDNGNSDHSLLRTLTLSDEINSLFETIETKGSFIPGEDLPVQLSDPANVETIHSGVTNAVNAFALKDSSDLNNDTEKMDTELFTNEVERPEEPVDRLVERPRKRVRGVNSKKIIPELRERVKVLTEETSLLRGKIDDINILRFVDSQFQIIQSSTTQVSKKARNLKTLSDTEVREIKREAVRKSREKALKTIEELKEEVKVLQAEKKYLIDYFHSQENSREPVVASAIVPSEPPVQKSPSQIDLKKRKANELEKIKETNRLKKELEERKRLEGTIERLEGTVKFLTNEKEHINYLFNETYIENQILAKEVEDLYLFVFNKSL